MKNVLVTGSGGFVGGHLVNTLLSRDCNVIGIGHGDIHQAANSPASDRYQYIQCDLTDNEHVSGLALPNTVDAVIHLAGHASVGPSFDNPQKYLVENSLMTVNVLELGLKRFGSARFLLISSGAVYDNSQLLPLTEQSATLPSSPYAVSKLTLEQLAKHYGLRGLDTVVARPFNHIGPGQGPGFLVPDLTRQIKQAQSAQATELLVGNLKSRRDYTDVRDVAEAYGGLALAESLGYDLYNVCSGRSISGEEIINLLFETMDIKDPPKLVVDQSRLRPNDPPDIYGSHDRLTESISWRPTYELRQTIKDCVDTLADR